MMNDESDNFVISSQDDNITAEIETANSATQSHIGVTNDLTLTESSHDGDSNISGSVPDIVSLSSSNSETFGSISCVNPDISNSFELPSLIPLPYTSTVRGRPRGRKGKRGRPRKIFSNIDRSHSESLKRNTLNFTCELLDNSNVIDHPLTSDSSQSFISTCEDNIDSSLELGAHFSFSNMKSKGSERRIDKKRSLDQLTSLPSSTESETSNSIKRSGRFKKQRNSEDVLSTQNELHENNGNFQEDQSYVNQNSELNMQENLSELIEDKDVVEESSLEDGQELSMSTRRVIRQRLPPDAVGEPTGSAVSLRAGVKRGRRSKGKLSTVHAESTEKSSPRSDSSHDSVSHLQKVSNDLSLPVMLARRGRSRGRSRGRYKNSQWGLVRRENTRESVMVGGNLVGFESPTDLCRTNSPSDSIGGGTDSDRAKKKKKKHFKGLNYSFGNRKKKSKPKNSKLSLTLDDEQNATGSPASLDVDMGSSVDYQETAAPLSLSPEYFDSCNASSEFQTQTSPSQTSVHGNEKEAQLDTIEQLQEYEERDGDEQQYEEESAGEEIEYEEYEDDNTENSNAEGVEEEWNSYADDQEENVEYAEDEGEVSAAEEYEEMDANKVYDTEYDVYEDQEYEDDNEYEYVPQDEHVGEVYADNESYSGDQDVVYEETEGDTQENEKDNQEQLTNILPDGNQEFSERSEEENDKSEADEDAIDESEGVEEEKDQLCLQEESKNSIEVENEISKDDGLKEEDDFQDSFESTQDSASERNDVLLPNGEHDDNNTDVNNFTHLNGDVEKLCSSSSKEIVENDLVLDSKLSPKVRLEKIEINTEDMNGNEFSDIEIERSSSTKRSLGEVEENDNESGNMTRKSNRISRSISSHPIAIGLPERLKKASQINNADNDDANRSLLNNLCKCCVKANSQAVNVSSDLYCQAMDSFDGRIIGCCNTVTNYSYVRVSCKIPFMLLCDIHRERLVRHNCCPGCGLFCTQGIFVECRWDKVGPRHYYHKLCGLLVKNKSLCPHCGSDQPPTDVHLELKLSRKPIVYLKQHQEKKGFNSSARMSLSSTLKVETDVVQPPSEDHMSMQLENGSLISPTKLPSGIERDQLTAAIAAIKMGKQFNLKASAKGIYWACKQGDLEKLLYVLAGGASPDARCREYGNQCGLHTAATHGCLPAIHILISAGATLDLIDSQLQTPLMIAIIKGHNDIINYFVQSGANLNAKTQDGMTCLHLAAKSGNYVGCKYILDSGRLTRHAINVQDEGGWTPLVWASENRCINVVRILLDRGANPQICDVEQNTALHWAAFSGSTNICSMVLDRGCSIRSMNAIGDTPLHIAARQNHVDAVVLLLARGACLDINNARNQTPLDCAIPDSDVFLQMTLNLKLKEVVKQNEYRNEKILSSDIAAGKEAVPIPIVNGIDDEGVPKDYVYLSENCEALNVNIDRTVNSLKWCDCEDGCSSDSCFCTQLSFQCWYDPEGKLLPDFNYGDPPMIFECNRACGCNKLSCHNRVVQHGITSHLQLFRTAGKGWGVRALKDIPKGSYVCEYVGEIITDLEADLREDDSYLFDLDNRDSETFCIDARQYGNVARFINHLCLPNLTPVKVFVDHQDLVFPRIALFANRDIEADEELGFDYGEKFWVIKYKQFTCKCRHEECKYSEFTIQATLSNYDRKMKEQKLLENGTAES